MGSADNLATLPMSRCLAPELAIAVIGPGRVGSRLLERLTAASNAWQLLSVANSTRMTESKSLAESSWQASLAASQQETDLDVLVERLWNSDSKLKVVVDVTASVDVAAHHVDWLANGLAVVTANKWALAAPRRQYRDLARLLEQPQARYEAAATVGAGLPVLATLDALHQAGEPIISFGGCLSGSMTFLTSRISAGQRPCQALADAVAGGLTEPDPRADLDGLDVARKLVILGRRAGLDLDLSEVEVDSLVPEGLRDATVGEFLAAGSALDACWAGQVETAPGTGQIVRHVGRVDGQGRARVGLEKVSDNDALASLAGADNLIEIHTDCYRETPLVIRGPGAGIDVTALALWGGLCRLDRGV
jgi:homoserine dehydrogenase